MNSLDFYTMASMTVNVLIVISLGIRVVSLTSNPSALKNILMIMGAFGLGIAVTQVVSDLARESGASLGGVYCQKTAGGWWNCGGWPITNDSVAGIISGLGSFFTAGLQIPALTAQALGGLYIHRRISNNFFLEPTEILKAFMGGIIVFASLVWLPALMAMTVELMAGLFMPGRVEEGKAILGGMLKAVDAYRGVAEDNRGLANYLKQAFLQFQIGVPGVILSLTAFLSIIVQSILLSLLPFYVFSTIISRQPDQFITFRVCMSYAAFTLFQSLLWGFISFYPSSYATGDISQISIGDAISAMFPIFLVSILIAKLFTAMPVSIAMSAFRSLAFVRIK